ncbi:MAG TPA: YihY/virulence factor BrkB family protein [Thermoanaerobaculia bacterium]|nr:YihY/virulence factor BrkB family protein [Thermoanaerobaculia bacterium]
MKKYLALFKSTWTKFTEDKAPRLGAALAYYTVFSIAPLLLIAVAIAGLAFGKQAAQGQIQQQLSNVMGASTAHAINEMVVNASKPKSGIVATIIGVVTLILGAAGVFAQLQGALDTIWNVERPKSAGYRRMIKDRFLSMGMVFGIGFMLLVTLVVDAAISAMGHYLIPGGAALLQVAQLVVSFGVVTLLFALIFKYLPHTKVEWRDVWFGAMFTSILFVLGKFGLALYIGKGSVGSAYGAAGSLIIILVWVYWSAQILFFGAEFTQVYARKQGSKAHSGAPAPSPAPLQPAYARPTTGGGKGKLAAGGIAGLIVGMFAGGLTATFIAVKMVKKIVALPFK